jgi:hypothetical protein
VATSLEGDIVGDCAGGGSLNKAVPKWSSELKSESLSPSRTSTSLSLLLCISEAELVDNEGSGCTSSISLLSVCIHNDWHHNEEREVSKRKSQKVRGECDV